MSIRYQTGGWETLAPGCPCGNVMVVIDPFFIRGGKRRRFSFCVYIQMFAISSLPIADVQVKYGA